MYLSNYALWQGCGQFIFPQVVPAWDPMKTDLLRICLFFIALNLVPHKKNNPNWLWIILCLSAFRAQQKPGGIFEPEIMFFAHMDLFDSCLVFTDSYHRCQPHDHWYLPPKSSPLVSSRVCWQKQSGMNLLYMIETVHCSDDNDDNVVTMQCNGAVSRIRHSEIWHCCHVCPALLKVASSSGFRKALMIYQWWHRIIRIKALIRFALGLNFYTKASQIKVSKHW